MEISTHTSREGSDLTDIISAMPLLAFQPTLPVREVTKTVLPYMDDIIISTHTSREGSDKKNIQIL